MNVATPSLRTWRAALPLLVVGLWACDASLGGAGIRGPGADGPSGLLEQGGPGGGMLKGCGQALGLADSPLLKLSTVQYRNTVRDLLERYDLGELSGQVEALLAAIPDDTAREGFRGLDDRVGMQHVQGYLDVGLAVGDAVVEDEGLLAAVAGKCATSTKLDDACWDDFVDGFLRSVQRRPLREDERALYEELRDSSDDGATAVRAAIVVSLSSPRFVYHLELEGPPSGSPDTYQLDAYEVASRLSYTFWQSMPDEELMASAEDGSLLDEEVYAEQLDRVWADPRTQDTLRAFWTEWLKLDDFTGFEVTRPGLQALAAGENLGEPGRDHYADMVEEIYALTELFTFEEPGTLEDLLLTDLSVTQSEDLASLYGVDVWDGKGEYPRMPEGERGGLLQRAALLVSNLETTNPFHRGALVRTEILCDPLAQPDPNALPPGSLDPPPLDLALTTRERFQAKVEGNMLCAGCHDRFSDIGYVMESFDALGRYRAEEQVFDEQTGDMLAELPIDTLGDVRIGSASEPPVDGPAELNRRIVESGKVEACLAQRYFRFLSRRAADESSLDSCVIDDLGELLSSQQGGLAVAFQRMATVPTFFNRKVGAP